MTNQLPLATINNVIRNKFRIVSANCEDMINTAIGIASATGSIGAQAFTTNVGRSPNFHEGIITKFAIVKRL